jgi:hypothetical protein
VGRGLRQDKTPSDGPESARQHWTNMTKRPVPGSAGKDVMGLLAWNGGCIQSNVWALQSAAGVVVYFQSLKV